MENRIFRNLDLEIDQMISVKKARKLVLDFAKNDHRGLEEVRKSQGVVIDKLYPTEIEHEYKAVVQKPNSDEQDLESYSIEKKMIKLNFFDDYLKPAIKNIKKKEIGRIELKREEKGKYSRDEKVGFYDHQYDEYKALNKKAQYANHLPQNIRNEIIEVIDEIQDYLRDKKVEANRFKIDKISFNLSKEDLCIFFALMYKTDVISNEMKASDLARTMEQCFTTEKTEELSNVKSLLSKYKKKESLSPKKIVEIKELLFKIFP